jgi:hypothetical protein
MGEGVFVGLCLGNPHTNTPLTIIGPDTTQETSTPAWTMLRVKVTLAGALVCTTPIKKTSMQAWL